MSADVEVMIVGAQLSGLSVRHFLHEAKVKEVFMIDACERNKASVNWISGTQGPELPHYTKMVLLPDDRGYSSLSHMLIGAEGARTYLRMKRNGVFLQKQIARSFDDPKMMRELGSVVLGGEDDERKLTEELNTYKELGFGSSLEQRTQEQIQEMFRTKEGRFSKGIFVRDDFIIDIDRYIGALSSRNSAMIHDGATLIAIKEKKRYVAATYRVKKGGSEEEHTIKAKHLILATNGFWRNDFLAENMRPFWSYVLCFNDGGENTPNGFYFSSHGHYFARHDNVLLVGGEDVAFDGKDFSTPYRREESLAKLRQWTHDTFPHLNGQQPIGEHYGPFVETPDNVPIIGRLPGYQRVYCIIGCQGDGQSTLTAGASLFPVFLGKRRVFSSEENDFIRLTDPNRDSLRKKTA